jgi:DNA helicase II / ATP-dependent DNA helicase PcrA
LLYVAMTRAKDSLHLIVPQRFFVSGQSALDDKHVYASRTRFIPAPLRSLFECTTWPVVAPDASRRAEAGQVKFDIGARMRSMWR